MKKYLVKQIFDAGVVVGYEIKHQTTAMALPRGGNFIFVYGVDTAYPKIQIDTDSNMSIIEDTAPKAIKTAYDLMVEDVYNEMENVFGTRNDVSASAFASTYEAMLKRPLSYIDIELGLADEAAVTAYAIARINASDAYGVFRLKRINQYQAEKAAILAGE